MQNDSQNQAENQSSQTEQITQLPQPKRVKLGKKVNKEALLVTEHIESKKDAKPARKYFGRVVNSMAAAPPEWIADAQKIKIPVPVVALKYLLYLKEYFLIAHGLDLDMDQCLNSAVNHFLEAERKNRKSYVFYVKVLPISTASTYMQLDRTHYLGINELAKRVKQPKVRLLLLAIVVVGETFRELTVGQAISMGERFTTEDV